MKSGHPKKLVFTWQWERAGGFPETVVTIQRFARGDRTELVLTHEGLPTQQDLDNHNRGWSSMLERLPAVL